MMGTLTGHVVFDGPRRYVVTEPSHQCASGRCKDNGIRAYLRMGEPTEYYCAEHHRQNGAST